MANVTGKHIIKANIIKDAIPINANIKQNEVIIKSQLTTLPSATTEQKGIIRIATLEEAIEGTNNSLAITPYTLKEVTTSDKTYIHEQGIASDTWIINHNLDKYPSVTLVNSADIQFIAEVEYNDRNTCTVYINGATKGKAYLN